MVAAQSQSDLLDVRGGHIEDRRSMIIRGDTLTASVPEPAEETTNR
jgi:hypothetical protein